MKKYISRRILMAFSTLLVIILILFLMLQFMPGSPFNDEKLTPEQLAIIEQQYGLDQPVIIQFFNYVKNMLKGNFGVSYSISRNTPVADILANRVPISMDIGFRAVLLGALAGLIFGTIAAFNRNTIWDTLATILSVLGVSIPSYVFALGLSYYLGFRWPVFPIFFNANAYNESVTLPVIALSLSAMATVSRYARTEMIEILDSDYVQLAESKGVTGSRLYFGHVLRNASISLVTVIAPLIVNLMTGSMVVEQIFSIPGLGQLLVQAIQSNDFNIIIAISFIYSAMYIVIMLVVDILYGILDPRISVDGGED